MYISITNIASIPEVLHDGENGCLIAPGDITNLTECLCNLISNVELRNKFSDASYKLVTRDFSLKKNIEVLKSIYKELE